MTFAGTDNSRERLVRGTGPSTIEPDLLTDQADCPALEPDRGQQKIDKTLDNMIVTVI
jgi:hypothetical protein